jgi:multidrug efflux pump subunit AcrB
MYDGYTDKTIKILDEDQIPLKGLPGYFMAWGGEMEDSSRAQASLAASIPIFFGIMVLIVIFLFNAVRQPLIIWLTVPLSLIGVTVGLLLFKQPFGFMALLGLMSLSGMLIKNAIVLIDEIDTQIRGGLNSYDAVVTSGVSRMRPVMMAALTTILGMIPLLSDAFFISMAVTIMFGLGFATVLTLIIVPVLYTVFFKIPNSPA